MSKKMEVARLLIRGRLGRGTIFSGIAALALGGAILAGALTSPAWSIIIALLGATSIAGIALIASVTIDVGKRGGISKQMDADSFQATHVRSYSIFLPVMVLLCGVASGFQILVLVIHPESRWQSWQFWLFSMQMFLLSWAYAKGLWRRGRHPSIRHMLADEFFQENLAMARSEGFAATLAAMPICFLVGLYDPRIGILLLPFAALVSVAVVGWRFSRRDAKAAEDDGV